MNYRGNFEETPSPSSTSSRDETESALSRQEGGAALVGLIINGVPEVFWTLSLPFPPRLRVGVNADFKEQREPWASPSLPSSVRNSGNCRWRIPLYMLEMLERVHENLIQCV